jgi:hypothetical protein
VLGVNYDGRNTDHSLDYAGPDPDVAGMSDQYLQDRADLLARKIYFAGNDINNDYAHPTNDRPAFSPRTLTGNPYLSGAYFEDRATQYVVLQGVGAVSKDDRKQIVFGSNQSNETINGGAYEDRLYGGAGSDSISGGSSDDYLEGAGAIDTLNGDAGEDTLLGGAGDDTLFGGADNDKLFGGIESDQLYGGTGIDQLHGGANGDFLYGDANNDQLDGDAGVDVLTGGTGDDTLRGGVDADSYIISPGDGNDTIDDVDGLGEIRLGVTRLNGGQAKYAGIWKEDLSSEEEVIYAFSPDANGRGDLRIQHSDGTITVKALSQRELGINLAAPVPDSIPTPSTTNNVIGTAGSDARVPIGSGSRLLGGVANDRIQGLAGRDELFGNNGDDIVEGGTGFDLVVGNDGKDEVFAEAALTEVQLRDYITTSATAPTVGAMPAKLFVNASDWLEGGLADDTVVAATAMTSCLEAAARTCWSAAQATTSLTATTITSPATLARPTPSQGPEAVRRSMPGINPSSFTTTRSWWVPKMRSTPEPVTTPSTASLATTPSGATTATTPCPAAKRTTCSSAATATIASRVTTMG